MPQDIVNKPDILFVGGFPLDMIFAMALSWGKNSALLRRVLGRIRKTRQETLRIAYTFLPAALSRRAYLMRS